MVKSGQTRAFDPSLSYDAKVTPFVFPDSGGVPIFNAISGAKEFVYIEIYQFANVNMYALLCELEKKGVDVILLIEADPESYGFDDVTQSRIKALIDAGGEVKLIGGVSKDRFNFVHAKYAIVDGTKTIVTSENWTTDNLNGKVRDGTYTDTAGNRGWGAVIESKGYTSYMTDVFMDDLNGSDVRDFSKVYPKAKAATLYYDAPSGGSFKTYSAKVTPMLSPDNSRDTEDYWMSKSNYRLYVQQQGIGNSYQDWTESTSPLFTLNSRASSGVDARLILNDSNTSKLVSDINYGSAIKAAVMDKPYVHNKGLVCDDVSIVSSVNWTSNSFKNNREVGVVIQSKDVADYYAGVFERDFNRYYEFSGLSVNITTTQKTYDLGKNVTFRVSVDPSGSYTYDWDFGDGQTKTTTVPSVTFTPTKGAHVLKVTVTDKSGQKATTSMDYVVVEPDADISVNITTTQKTYELGKSATFKVAVNPSGSYTYDWDFGDGQTKTTTNPSVTFTPTKGAHVLKVTVSDSSGHEALASMSYNVVDPADQGSDDSGDSGGSGGHSLIYIAIIVIAVIGAALVKKLK